ncbi:MAG: phosphate ABC transporter permease subunit PstC [Aggregatilineales bacterium]
METPINSGAGATPVPEVQRQTAADRLAGATVDLSWHPRLSERLIAAALFLAGAVSIVTTIGIVVVLGREALNFFITTEWLNTNRTLSAAISAEDTRISVSRSGGSLNVGDLIRIGALGTEYVLILETPDNETIVVERGARGTPIEPHPVNSTLYKAAEVTLWKFISETRWAPQIGQFGIRPLLNSTLITSAIAILVALPIGLGAAIYISEYASRSARKVLKPMIEILAGVPTVVYGYFALTFVTPLLRSLLGVNTVEVYNMFSAGLVMGIMIIPTISSISEDALNAVPQSLRDASYGLGATRLETSFRVLIPAALSGIVAAVILGISRAVGETMIVLIAAGAGPNLTMNPFDAAESMAAHIARISTGDIPVGSIDYNSVFAVGLTLFLLTLVLNLISTFITRRFREVYS